jgi:hypothetical protein
MPLTAKIMGMPTWESHDVAAVLSQSLSEKWSA